MNAYQNPDRKLTVLSFGGGQDSSAILIRLLHDPEFYARHVGDDNLVVVMSDTGGEHPYTYDHVETCRKICEARGLPFFLLRAKDGFHAPSWPDIYTPQLRDEGGDHVPTMVMRGTQTCTGNLKIGPIYKFIDEYINLIYGYGFKVAKERGCRKLPTKRYRSEFGRIRVLLGFAAGEESRRDRALRLEAKEQEAGNWQATIARAFPLIDCGMDRAACREYLRSHGLDVMPSNCMICPYMALPELLWLARNYPEIFEIWVLIEDRKRQRHGDKPRNQGVFARKESLREKLAEAERKYGHLTDEELAEYKATHGCQTAF